MAIIQIPAITEHVPCQAEPIVSLGYIVFRSYSGPTNSYRKRPHIFTWTPVMDRLACRLQTQASQTLFRRVQGHGDRGLR
jgi:hypothetical protein